MATDTYDARLLDLLGETESGGFEDPYNGATPATLEGDVLANRRLRAQRAEEARLATIPYGTPVSQGGTAGVYQVTNEGMGTRRDPYSQTSIAVTQPPAEAGQAGAGGKLGMLNDPGDIQLDATRRTEQGSQTRNNQLQGIIDRFDALTMDTTQSDESRRVQREAESMNRQLFQQASSFDRDAAASKYSEEALASALAVARSAPGAASRESALFNALESLPALKAEGQRQANEEARRQQGVALQAAGQLGQQATQTRGQDEARAETFASLGLDVAKSIANITGQDMQLDQRDREFLGEVALAVARLNLDTQRLSVEEQIAAVNQELARQGLDQEWRMFKESGKITDRDILGGIFSIAGAGIQGLATGGAR